MGLHESLHLVPAIDNLRVSMAMEFDGIGVSILLRLDVVLFLQLTEKIAMVVNAEFMNVLCNIMLAVASCVGDVQAQESTRKVVDGDVKGDAKHIGMGQILIKRHVDHPLGRQVVVKLK